MLDFFFDTPAPPCQATQPYTTAARDLRLQHRRHHRALSIDNGTDTNAEVDAFGPVRRQRASPAVGIGVAVPPWMTTSV